MGYGGVLKDEIEKVANEEVPAVAVDLKLYCTFGDTLQHSGPKAAMSKREASMFAAQGVDVDAPRAKRHKGPAATPGSPAKDDTTSVNGVVGKVEGGEVEVVKEEAGIVKEKGLKLWHLVKDAVNKEGRSLSYDFLRLPSKRQYADYYQQIKHPVSLDEIKHQLDNGYFSTFEQVRQEFETCFRNAKRYNLRDSQIWKDAKHLHKLVQKESAKLSGSTNPEGADDAAASGEGEGGKKKKAPNMSRLLKSRLQKLIEKTDDSGRMRSTEFMELPSKKAWPMYYKTIKKPQCLENIFKRLKRKEYYTTLDFANDVELVFSNAMEFNQEHTEIWEDAIVLRDYFRQLMSDLPPPFAIAAYASNDHSTKIKLKVPAPHSGTIVAPNPQTAPAATPPGPSSNSPGTLLLRIPALGATTPTPPAKPLAPSPKSPTVPLRTTPTPSTPTPTLQTLPPSTQSHAYTPVAPSAMTTPAQPNTVQPPVFAQAQYAAAYTHHYSTPVYQQAKVPAPATTAAPPQTPIPTPILTMPSPAPPVHVAPQRPQIQTQMPPPPPSSSTSRPATASGPPTPVIVQNVRPLRCVTLLTRPRGRRLDLDYRDGVKTWAVRLAPFESSIHIGGIKFMDQTDEAEEGSSDEEDEDGDTQMKDGTGTDPKPEEEEEDEEDGSGAPESLKDKPKRGRGRPRKNLPPVPVSPSKLVKGKEPATGKDSTSTSSPPPADMQVKLNGVAKISSVGKDEWDVDLPVGSNILEVGEKGGLIWRVYLERLAG